MNRLRELLRNRLLAATGGLAAFPLLLLVALNTLDEIDTSAAAVLAPEIKVAFGLSNSGFSLVVAINFLVVLLAAVGIGYIGDRTSRVRLAQGGALIAGVGSVLTGSAVGLWFLVAARLVNGTGLLVNGPIHKSLLADYYRPENRAAAFALHEAANPLGRIIAPLLVGATASLLSWRGPFIIFAIPVLIGFVLSLRLREPIRGGTDDAHDAMAAAQERPVSFGRGVRLLAQARTLRRSWLGLFFVGAGFLPLLTFLAIFYDTVFGVGPFARGLIATLSSIAALVGLMIAARVVRVVLERHGAKWVQLIAGLSLAAMGPLLVLFAFQRELWLAVVLGTVIPLVGGFFGPASLTVQSLVAPPRVRSQGFAFGFLFLAVGAFLTPMAGRVADTSGVRWGLVAVAPFLFVGGIVFASAYRFVEADRARALATLATAAELHEQRLEAGEKALLLCRGVDVSYDGVQVLFGVDFEVKEGELVALLGTNGAGKSTLLRAISGLTPPQAGLVFFAGEEISSMTPWEVAQQGIVLMPGGKSVFPTLTVRENLRLAGWLTKDRPAELAARTDEVLDIFPRLRERIDTSAGDLSGGEQQMVSLAQALLSSPRLLMIDELSLGLSPKVVGELLDIVRRIHATGVTVVLVEQSVNVALTVADHAYFMEKGEIRYDGPTAELLNRPDILRAVFLEGAGSVS